MLFTPWPSAIWFPLRSFVFILLTLGSHWTGFKKTNITWFMLRKDPSGYFVGNGFQKAKTTSQEDAALLASWEDLGVDRVSVGPGEKGTDWGYVWEVELAGHSDGLGVGVKKERQSGWRHLGAWPEKPGGWQLWEMTRGGIGLEKGDILEFH